MANRIWQWHFGEGIVRTPSNFGKAGERPTHPELLDYLASSFIERGWSIKSMHRLLMLSNAYQMSSLASPGGARPRRGRRLAVSLSGQAARGGRDSRFFAGARRLAGFDDGRRLLSGRGTDKEFSDDRMSLNPDQSKRRTVYLPLRRSNLPSVLTLFDFGDATTPGEGRSQTNVAPQALYMMNSDFVAKQARSLASQLLGDGALDDAGRIRGAYYRVLKAAAAGRRGPLRARVHSSFSR